MLATRMPTLFSQVLDCGNSAELRQPLTSRIQGRGIYLMKALMDAVRFDEMRTVVHMLKRSDVPSALVGVAK